MVKMIDGKHVQFTEREIPDGFEYNAHFNPGGIVEWRSKDRLTPEEAEKAILKKRRALKEGKQFGR
jgi:hypothetical protein